MKKVLFILLGIALTTASMAQTPAQQVKKKEEMKDLHRDVAEKRHDNKKMAKHITHAKFKKAVADRKEKREDKKDIHKDQARLERQGVKHPVAKVKHQMKAEKEEKKARY